MRVDKENKGNLYAMRIIFLCLALSFFFAGGCSVIFTSINLSMATYHDTILLPEDESFDHSMSPPSSPLLSPSQNKRQRSSRYHDLAGSMNRLRSSMGGEAFSSLLSDKKERQTANRLIAVLGQVPAIALIGMFHLMIGIPFGVSYFPVNWGRGGSGNNSIKHVNNNTEQFQDYSKDFSGEPFPIPGKEALGIRMFLFSTIVGQIVFTLTSEFDNPIGLQMVENVPFCHELSYIVISHQGYGVDALSTLMVMFGLASVVVGIVFYSLGHYKLGRIVYFFPTHVLVGCIGGIGVFIAKTGIEVTLDDALSFGVIADKWHLWMVVLAMEIVLRILEHTTKDSHGKPKYTLLSPIYFCMITPLFYLGLFILQIPVSMAEKAGYFFPSLDNDNIADATTPPTNCLGNSCPSLSSSASSTLSTSLWQSDLWDMWRVISLPNVSWSAIGDSIPTLVALVLFSLIHGAVPRL